MGEYDKGAEARKHIIMSHGGKHGGSQTFLKGAPIPADTAKMIPKGSDLIAPADLSGMVVPVPAPAATSLTPEAPPASGAVPSATPTTPPAAAGTPAAAGNTGEVPPAKPPMPTNVRELFALNKEELLALALDLNVSTEGDPTVKGLRESLKTALEF